jgi:hypothetical protein
VGLVEIDRDRAGAGGGHAALLTRDWWRRAAAAEVEEDAYSADQQDQDPEAETAEGASFAYLH